MILGKRVLKSQPLTFQNPFHTTGFSHVLDPARFSRVPMQGISNAEAYANSLRMKRYAELANAGFTAEQIREWRKKDPQFNLAMDENGIFSIPLGVGVTSLKDRDKRLDMLRQVEMANAGIYSGKIAKDRALRKIYEKMQEKKLEKKVYQWIHENMDEDSIPNSLRDDYHAWDKKKDPTTAGNKNKVVRQERNPDPSGKEKEITLDQDGEKLNFPDDKDTMDSEEVEAIIKAIDDKDKIKKETDDEGSGAFSSYRVPRLHQMVAPIHQREASMSAKDDIEEHKREVEDRQEIYKEQQKDIRGEEPPKGMVERAVPKTAEPIQLTTITEHPSLNRLSITIAPFYYHDRTSPFF